MVTKFGRFCRDLRMDNGELLFDMAQKLNVSSAFLSKVENGKAKPPVNWKIDIRNEYNLDSEQANILSKCIDEARTVEVISLKDLSEDDRDMMLKFARKLNNMDFESKMKIKDLLK